MELPRAVVIHGVVQARAALAPGLPVLLLSAAGAAEFAGAGWWRAVIAAAGGCQPDALDCGDAPGRALEALSLGCGIIVLAPGPAWNGIVARAVEGGAGTALVLAARPPALDLGQAGSARWLERWLQGDSEVPLG